MEERNLFRASLICSLMGILLIIFIASRMEVPQFSISELNKDLIDQEIKVTGSIINIKETKGLIILTLKDYTGSMPIIIFKPVEETFKKGTKIEAIGKVSEFKKELQLTAEEIKTI